MARQSQDLTGHPALTNRPPTWVRWSIVGLYVCVVLLALGILAGARYVDHRQDARNNQTCTVLAGQHRTHATQALRVALGCHAALPRPHP